MDGLELQREIRQRRLPLPVIVMTGHGDVALAVEAMKAGAVDFLEKPFDDERLLSAVRAAVSRHSEASARDDEVAAIKARLATLSQREREVLEALTTGQANKTIAYHLGISARTVEVHRANLMTKMAATSLSELVRMVFVLKAEP